MPALISSLAVNVFDHSQRHRAVVSRRESVRPRQIRFFLSEETPPALSGLTHPFSCNPDTRDETLRHLAAFSQATVFLPALFTCHAAFFFRRHDNDRPSRFSASVFLQPRHPRRNAPAPCGIFSSNRFFAPHSLPDAPHFSFGSTASPALSDPAAARLGFKFLHK